MEWLAWAKALIAWIPARGKIMVILVLISALALFINPAWLAPTVAAWVLGHRVVEWGVFLFFALFLILDTGQRAAGGLLERVRFKRRLRTLTEIERRTLSELFNAETSRIIAWPHDERIGSLHNENFLVALPGEVYGRKTYLLNPAIRKWISKKQLPV
jgi:hypothetical protein